MGRIMDNRIEIMKSDLENAKQELKRKQDNLKWYVDREINSSTFEKNAISDLITMAELKEKIKMLEFYLSLQ